MTDQNEIPMDVAPIIACTISRDVQNFDLLIEDMESALGEQWGDLSFDEAIPFFAQPDAEALEFVALAMDDLDEEILPQLGEIITTAKGRGIKVVLIAEDVTPAALHQLLRRGADEFVPYPLPEGELAFAIDRMRAPEPEPEVQAADEDVYEDEDAPAERKVKLRKGSQQDGVVIAVHGLAGGTGATTFAVNLAWELANITKKDGPKVCILDLDLQFGSVATFLDLPRREAVYELLSDTESMDEDSFSQALMSFEDKVQVLTAPADVLPLDLLTPQDVETIVDMARAHFDYVIVDMPTTLVQWSETVLCSAHVYFAMLELDMRSAQNALRLKRALQAEDLPFEKMRFIMNRAPKFTDLSGKSRVKRMAESLGIGIDVLFPDGGKPVTQACDHGLPIASSAAKNPLRKEIAKLAAQIHELGQNNDAEAA
ncbi:AAA family ATPase [Primorskyibacter sp. S187A]|uniref:AAA family ATPase n=1 Tax=Primorskyibacter sp. S187A TaxID=3415130 RepID=UPI003C7D0066